MRPRDAVVTLFVLAMGCRTTHTQRLDALFTALHERGLFDGAVVVGNDRRIAWEKGYGFANVEKRVAFTPETPADGGSLAKTFTAALLLQLQREGIVNLDDPAQRLLPELPYPQITLRHLLSHSSGIPILDYDFFDPHIPRGEVRTTERLLRVLAEEKPQLASVPGSSFEYSSFGFDLAALAAARATGRSYAQLLEERFFQPLGITSAFARPARFNDFPGIRTLGYRRNDGALEVHDVFPDEAFHGGSNIYISARDLHRWNASQIRDPLREAHESATIGGHPSGLTLGSWYRTADGSAFWYSGHLQGFHDEVFRNVKSNRSIVYVSNNTMEPWLQRALIRAVNAILDGRDPPAMVAPRTDAVRKEDRPSLAGDWLLPGGDIVTIDSSGAKLSVVHDGVSYRMVAVDSRTFYVPGLDWMVGFTDAASRMSISTNVDLTTATRQRR